MSAALRVVANDERVISAKETFTSPEVIALTGVTYRQLDFWARSGLLPDTAHGSGSVRRFTQRDVDLVRAVLSLLDAGFTLRAAFDVARVLGDRGRWVATSGRLFLAVTDCGAVL